MADIWYDVDTALSEVPVNILPLLDATDFKTIEDAVAYNAAGLALYWHFVTTGGAYTVTAVTPTTAGNYDWTDQGAAGIYTIEIPASGGASINNDTEGFGWFTGVATGVLPWRGPVCGFRAAAINNSLIDGATVDVNVTAMAANVITATAINADAITAAKIATGAIDADAIADNAIDAGAIAADAITAAKIADGAIDLATFAADAKALFGVIAFGTAQSVTGTTIRLASAETFADDEIIGATVIIRSATTGAGQARVITDYVSSTDTATVDTWTTTPTGTITYVVIATAPGSSTLPVTANVTQWAGSAVATPTVAGVPEVDLTHVAGSTTNVSALATNVDAILTDTAVIGSTGQGLTSLATQASVNTIDDFLDTEIAAILAAVDTEVAAIKAKTDNLPATPAATGDIPSAATIADAVWDEATSGHTTAGSTGKALTDASSAGDPWSTALPGAYGAGTAGYLIGTNLDAPVSTVDTVVDAIKAKTDSLTFTVANKVDSNIKSVNNVTVNGDGAGTPWGP